MEWMLGNLLYSRSDGAVRILIKVTGCSGTDFQSS
jgi:hypothetical protein